MNRTTKAFLITLALYLLLLLLLVRLPKEHSQGAKRRTVTSLNLKQLRIEPKKAIKPHNLAKKLIEKPPKLHPKRIKKKKKIHKVKKKVKKLQKKRVKIAKEQNLTKRYRKPLKVAKKQTPKAPSLASLFAQSRPESATKTTSVRELPAQYRKLYKDEFNSYTKAQKEFLKDNLSKIGAITQKYLYLRGYPYISLKTKQQGQNAVEFYLHPNGDITGLRLITSSGYEALDQNSLETIKAAYKDYPLPKETTKVRIYVEYRLIY